MEIVWENEPFSSGDAVKLSFAQLGWKKSTVYTVIKKLCEKNAIATKDAIITSKIKKEHFLEQESKNIIEEKFGGSLSIFLTSFIKKEKISQKQAEELKKLINEYTEEEI